jgi:hypothetical protein
LERERLEVEFCPGEEEEMEEEFYFWAGEGTWKHLPS